MYQSGTDTIIGLIIIVLPILFVILYARTPKTWKLIVALIVYLIIVFSAGTEFNNLQVTLLNTQEQLEHLTTIVNNYAKCYIDAKTRTEENFCAIGFGQDLETYAQTYEE